MAQSKEKIPMIKEHLVTRLQDSIVVFGGTVASRFFVISDMSYAYIVDYRNKRTIWLYNLHTDLWRKYMIPKDKKVPPLSPESTAVTIKTAIYVFAAPKDNLCTLWQLKRDMKVCFSWCEVPVKKAPSHRHNMARWEYAGKLWIFGGCGPSTADGGLLAHCRLSFNANHSVNNQLLCFDPSCREWTSVKCTGAVPSHRSHCTSAVIGNKTWLYGGQLPEHLGELYNLDMNHSFWTQIRCIPSIPKVNLATLIFTGNKLVLHGRSESSYSFIDPNETWILNLSLMLWEEYKTKQPVTRFEHKCISGLNSCVLIGGIELQYKSTLFTTLAPKSLQEFAIKKHNRTQSYPAMETAALQTL